VGARARVCVCGCACVCVYRQKRPKSVLMSSVLVLSFSKAAIDEIRVNIGPDTFVGGLTERFGSEIFERWIGVESSRRES